MTFPTFGWFSLTFLPNQNTNQDGQDFDRAVWEECERMTSAASESAELANSVAQANQKRYEEQVATTLTAGVAVGKLTFWWPFKRGCGWYGFFFQLFSGLAQGWVERCGFFKVFQDVKRCFFSCELGRITNLCHSPEARERRERKRAEQKELREWERNKDKRAAGWQVFMQNVQCGA